MNFLFPEMNEENQNSRIKDSDYYIKKYDLLDEKKETRNIFSEPPKTKKFTTQEIIDKIQLVKQEDEFEGTTLIFHNHISQEDCNYLPMYFEKITDKLVSVEHIGLSFIIFENQIFLNAHSFVKEMGLAKNDRLILLFENNHKIEIVFQNARISGTIKSNIYLLSPKELEIFIKNDLRKWKLISSRRNLFIVGDNTLFHEKCQIQDKISAQEVLKYLANSILIEYLKTNKEHTAHNNGSSQITGS